MDRTPARLGGLVALVVAFLCLATTPAAAQSVNKALINNLNRKLLYVALPLMMSVEFIICYTIYRYRNNDDPAPTEENRRLEITWTVVTAIILAFVGIASMVVLANPYISPVAAADAGGPSDPTNQYLQGQIQPDDPNAVEVEALAYQWGWEFRYRGENVTTKKKLVLPENREVYLYVSSKDVIHSFYSPKLGLKQDAMPGTYATIRTNLTEQGVYPFYCAEFCGSGHARMGGDVVAVSNEEYRSWLEEQRSGGNATAGATADAADESDAGNDADLLGNATTATASDGGDVLANVTNGTANGTASPSPRLRAAERVDSSSSASA